MGESTKGPLPPTLPTGVRATQGRDPSQLELSRDPRSRFLFAKDAKGRQEALELMRERKHDKGQIYVLETLAALLDGDEISELPVLQRLNKDEKFARWVFGDSWDSPNRNLNASIRRRLSELRLGRINLYEPPKKIVEKAQDLVVVTAAPPPGLGQEQPANAALLEGLAKGDVHAIGARTVSGPDDLTEILGRASKILEKSSNKLRQVDIRYGIFAFASLSTAGRQEAAGLCKRLVAAAKGPQAHALLWEISEATRTGILSAEQANALLAPLTKADLPANVRAQVGVVYALLAGEEGAKETVAQRAQRASIHLLCLHAAGKSDAPVDLKVTGDELCVLARDPDLALMILERGLKIAEKHGDLGELSKALAKVWLQLPRAISWKQIQAHPDFADLEPKQQEAAKKLFDQIKIRDAARDPKSRGVQTLSLYDVCTLDVADLPQHVQDTARVIRRIVCSSTSEGCLPKGSEARLVEIRENLLGYLSSNVDTKEASEALVLLTPYWSQETVDAVVSHPSAQLLEGLAPHSHLLPPDLQQRFCAGALARLRDPKTPADQKTLLRRGLLLFSHRWQPEDASALVTADDAQLAELLLAHAHRMPKHTRQVFQKLLLTRLTGSRERAAAAIIGLRAWAGELGAKDIDDIQAAIRRHPKITNEAAATLLSIVGSQPDSPVSSKAEKVLLGLKLSEEAKQDLGSVIAYARGETLKLDVSKSAFDLLYSAHMPTPLGVLFEQVGVKDEHASKQVAKARKNKVSPRVIRHVLTQALTYNALPKQVREHPSFQKVTKRTEPVYLPEVVGALVEGKLKDPAKSQYGFLTKNLRAGVDAYLAGVRSYAETQRSDAWLKDHAVRTHLNAMTAQVADGPGFFTRAYDGFLWAISPALLYESSTTGKHEAEQAKMVGNLSAKEKAAEKARLIAQEGGSKAVASLQMAKDVGEWAQLYTQGSWRLADHQALKAFGKNAGLLEQLSPTVMAEVTAKDQPENETTLGRLVAAKELDLATLPDMQGRQGVFDLMGKTTNVDLTAYALDELNSDPELLDVLGAVAHFRPQFEVISALTQNPEGTRFQELVDDLKLRAESLKTALADPDRAKAAVFCREDLKRGIESLPEGHPALPDLKTKLKSVEGYLNLVDRSTLQHVRRGLISQLRRLPRNSPPTVSKELKSKIEAVDSCLAMDRRGADRIHYLLNFVTTPDFDTNELETWLRQEGPILAVAVAGAAVAGSLAVLTCGASGVVGYVIFAGAGAVGAYTGQHIAQGVLHDLREAGKTTLGAGDSVYFQWAEGLEVFDPNKEGGKWVKVGWDEILTDAKNNLTRSFLISLATGGVGRVATPAIVKGFGSGLSRVFRRCPKLRDRLMARVERIMKHGTEAERQAVRAGFWKAVAHEFKDEMGDEAIREQLAEKVLTQVDERLGVIAPMIVATKKGVTFKTITLHATGFAAAHAHIPEIDFEMTVAQFEANGHEVNKVADGVYRMISPDDGQAFLVAMDEAALEKAGLLEDNVSALPIAEPKVLADTQDGIFPEQRVTDLEVQVGDSTAKLRVRSNAGQAPPAATLVDIAHAADVAHTDRKHQNEPVSNSCRQIANNLAFALEQTETGQGLGAGAALLSTNNIDGSSSMPAGWQAPIIWGSHTVTYFESGGLHYAVDGTAWDYIPTKEGGSPPVAEVMVASSRAELEKLLQQHYGPSRPWDTTPALGAPVGYSDLDWKLTELRQADKQYLEQHPQPPPGSGLAAVREWREDAPLALGDAYLDLDGKKIWARFEALRPGVGAETKGPTAEFDDLLVALKGKRPAATGEEVPIRLVDSFALLGAPDQAIADSGVKYVVVSNSYYHAIGALQAAFPNVTFVRADEANVFLEGELAKVPKKKKQDPAVSHGTMAQEGGGAEGKAHLAPTQPSVELQNHLTKEEVDWFYDLPDVPRQQRAAVALLTRLAADPSRTFNSEHYSAMLRITKTGLDLDTIVRLPPNAAISLDASLDDLHAHKFFFYPDAPLTAKRRFGPETQKAWDALVAKVGNALDSVSKEALMHDLQQIYDQGHKIPERKITKSGLLREYDAHVVGLPVYDAVQLHERITRALNGLPDEVAATLRKELTNFNQTTHDLEEGEPDPNEKILQSKTQAKWDLFVEYVNEAEKENGQALIDKVADALRPVFTKSEGKNLAKELHKHPAMKTILRDHTTGQIAKKSITWLRKTWKELDPSERSYAKMEKLYRERWAKLCKQHNDGPGRELGIEVGGIPPGLHGGSPMGATDAVRFEALLGNIQTSVFNIYAKLADPYSTSVGTFGRSPKSHSSDDAIGVAKHGELEDRFSTLTHEWDHWARGTRLVVPESSIDVAYNLRVEVLAALNQKATHDAAAAQAAGEPNPMKALFEKTGLGKLVRKRLATYSRSQPEYFRHFDDGKDPVKLVVDNILEAARADPDSDPYETFVAIATDPHAYGGLYPLDPKLDWGNRVNKVIDLKTQQKLRRAGMTDQQIYDAVVKRDWTAATVEIALELTRDGTLPLAWAANMTAAEIEQTRSGKAPSGQPKVLSDAHNPMFPKQRVTDLRYQIAGCEAKVRVRTTGQMPATETIAAIAHAGHAMHTARSRENDPDDVFIMPTVLANNVAAALEHPTEANQDLSVNPQLLSTWQVDATGKGMPPGWKSANSRNGHAVVYFESNGLHYAVDPRAWEYVPEREGGAPPVAEILVASSRAELDELLDQHYGPATWTTDPAVEAVGYSVNGLRNLELAWADEKYKKQQPQSPHELSADLRSVRDWRKNGALDLRALETSELDVWERFDAHAVAVRDRSAPTSDFDDLVAVLNGERQASDGNSDCLVDSFVLMGAPDKSIDESGVKYVIVNTSYDHAIDVLAEAYPEVTFVGAKDANDFLKAVLDGDTTDTTQPELLQQATTDIAELKSLIRRFRDKPSLDAATRLYEKKIAFSALGKELWLHQSINTASLKYRCDALLDSMGQASAKVSAGWFIEVQSAYERWMKAARLEDPALLSDRSKALMKQYEELLYGDFKAMCLKHASETQPDRLDASDREVFDRFIRIGCEAATSVYSDFERAIGQSPGKSEAEVIQDVLSKLPKKSNLVFFHERGDGWGMESLLFTEMDDNAVIRLYEETFDVSYETHGKPDGLTKDQYRAEVLERARISLTRDALGGIGATGRTLEEMEKDIPGLKNRLAQEQGKIVFLGNGLSPAPLEAVQAFKSGRLQTPPVILDVIDYAAVAEDLAQLKKALEAKGIDFPFDEELEAAREITLAEAEGDLVVVQCLLGQDPVPEQAKDASLVINSHGPGLDTLPEQVSLLRDGGDLATTNDLTKHGPVGLRPVTQDGAVNLKIARKFTESDQPKVADQDWVAALAEDTPIAHKRISGVSVTLGQLDIFSTPEIDAVMIPQMKEGPHGGLAYQALAAGARMPEPDTHWNEPRSIGDAWWVDVDPKGETSLKKVANLICMHSHQPGMIYSTVLSGLKQIAQANADAKPHERVTAIGMPPVGAGISGDATTEQSAKTILRAVKDFGEWAAQNGISRDALPRVVLGVLGDSQVNGFSQVLEAGTFSDFPTTEEEAEVFLHERLSIEESTPFSLEAETYILPLPNPDPSQSVDPTTEIIAEGIESGLVDPKLLETWREYADEIIADGGAYWSGGTKIVSAVGSDLTDPVAIRRAVHKALLAVPARDGRVILPRFGAPDLDPEVVLEAMKKGVLDFILSGRENEVVLAIPNTSHEVEAKNKPGNSHDGAPAMSSSGTSDGPKLSETVAGQRRKYPAELSDELRSQLEPEKVEWFDKLAVPLSDKRAAVELLRCSMGRQFHEDHYLAMVNLMCMGLDTDTILELPQEAVIQLDKWSFVFRSERFFFQPDAPPGKRIFRPETQVAWDGLVAKVGDALKAHAGPVAAAALKQDLAEIYGDGHRVPENMTAGGVEEAVNPEDVGLPIYDSERLHGRISEAIDRLPHEAAEPLWREVSEFNKTARDQKVLEGLAQTEWDRFVKLVVDAGMPNSQQLIDNTANALRPGLTRDDWKLVIARARKNPVLKSILADHGRGQIVKKSITALQTEWNRLAPRDRSYSKMEELYRARWAQLSQQFNDSTGRDLGVKLEGVPPGLEGGSPTGATDQTRLDLLLARMHKHVLDFYSGPTNPYSGELGGFGRSPRLGQTKDGAIDIINPLAMTGGDQEETVRVILDGIAHEWDHWARGFEPTTAKSSIDVANNLRMEVLAELNGRLATEAGGGWVPTPRRERLVEVARGILDAYGKVEPEFFGPFQDGLDPVELVVDNILEAVKLGPHPDPHDNYNALLKDPRSHGDLFPLDPALDWHRVNEAMDLRTQQKLRRAGMDTEEILEVVVEGGWDTATAEVALQLVRDGRLSLFEVSHMSRADIDRETKQPRDADKVRPAINQEGRLKDAKASNADVDVKKARYTQHFESVAERDGWQEIEAVFGRERDVLRQLKGKDKQQYLKNLGQRLMQEIERSAGSTNIGVHLDTRRMSSPSLYVSAGGIVDLEGTSDGPRTLRVSGDETGFDLYDLVTEPRQSVRVGDTVILIDLDHPFFVEGIDKGHIHADGSEYEMDREWLEGTELGTPRVVDGAGLEPRSVVGPYSTFVTVPLRWTYPDASTQRSLGQLSDEERLLAEMLYIHHFAVNHPVPDVEESKDGEPDSLSPPPDEIVVPGFVPETAAHEPTKGNLPGNGSGLALQDLGHESNQTIFQAALSATRDFAREHPEAAQEILNGGDSFRVFVVGGAADPNGNSRERKDVDIVFVDSDDATLEFKRALTLFQTYVQAQGDEILGTNRLHPMLSQLDVSRPYLEATGNFLDALGAPNVQDMDPDEVAYRAKAIAMLAGAQSPEQFSSEIKKVQRGLAKIQLAQQRIARGASPQGQFDTNEEFLQAGIDQVRAHSANIIELADQLQPSDPGVSQWVSAVQDSMRSIQVLLQDVDPTQPDLVPAIHDALAPWVFPTTGSGGNEPSHQTAKPAERGSQKDGVPWDSDLVEDLQWQWYDRALAIGYLGGVSDPSSVKTEIEGLVQGLHDMQFALKGSAKGRSPSVRFESHEAHFQSGVEAVRAHASNVIKLFEQSESGDPRATRWVAAMQESMETMVSLLQSEEVAMAPETLQALLDAAAPWVVPG
ncbi:hypothetical protein ACFL6C_03000 [Myxococcota bacterium]